MAKLAKFLQGVAGAAGGRNREPGKRRGWRGDGRERLERILRHGYDEYGDECDRERVQAEIEYCFQDCGRHAGEPD